MTRLSLEDWPVEKHQIVPLSVDDRNLFGSLWTPFCNLLDDLIGLQIRLIGISRKILNSFQDYLSAWIPLALNHGH